MLSSGRPEQGEDVIKLPSPHDHRTLLLLLLFDETIDKARPKIVIMGNIPEIAIDCGTEPIEEWPFGGFCGSIGWCRFCDGFYYLPTSFGG